MEITLPSGLRGEIRKLKVKELALLSDAKLARTGRLTTEIVQSCWLRTLDPGPYVISDMSRLPPPSALLHADRTCAFRDIRIASRGPLLEWDVQCPAMNCGHKFLAVQDLTQMRVQPLPEASRQHVATGEPFTTVVAGRRVLWRLLRAADDERLLKYIEQDIPMITAVFMSRIVAVDNVESNDPQALRAWMEDLDLEDNEVFQAAMDAAEATVHQQTTIQCTRCRTTWETPIPLVQAFLSRVTSRGKNSSMPEETTSSPPQLSLPGAMTRSADPV